MNNIEKNMKEVEEMKEEIKRKEISIKEEIEKELKSEAGRLLTEAIASVSEDLKKSPGKEIDIYIDFEEVILYKGFYLPRTLHEQSFFLTALKIAVAEAANKNLFCKVNPYNEEKGKERENSLQLSVASLK